MTMNRYKYKYRYVGYVYGVNDRYVGYLSIGCIYIYIVIVIL